MHLSESPQKTSFNPLLSLSRILKMVIRRSRARNPRSSPTEGAGGKPGSRRKLDVHSQLSDHFRAYSVFKPAPERHLDLFQVVIIHTKKSMRSRSPKKTKANLQKIFSRIQRRAPANTALADIAEEFMDEFSIVEDVPPDPDYCTGMTVSESSLCSAGVGVTAGGVVSAGASASFSKSTTRTLQLSNVSQKEYIGDELKSLIWTHADLVFRKILEKIDMDIGFVKGDRSLVAVVTNKIVATVGVSKTSTDTRNVGASGGDGAILEIRAGVERSRISEESFDNHPGICGLHFIVFPVEMVDLFKWRIYRGIELCDAETDMATPDVTEAKKDTFHQVKGWQRRSPGASLHPTAGYRDVEQNQESGANARASIEDLSEELSSDEMDYNYSDDVEETKEGEWPSAMKPTENLADWVDVHRGHTPVPWIEIDLKDGLASFALNQCDIASYYLALPVRTSEEDEYVVKILRSALRKCCFEAIVMSLYSLAECYKRGIGVTQCKNMTRKLTQCARMLKQCYISRGIWCTVLSVDVQFTTGLTPEQRILDLIDVLNCFISSASTGLELISSAPGQSVLVVHTKYLLRGVSLPEMVKIRSMMLYEWCSDVAFDNAYDHKLPEKLFIPLPSYIAKDATSPSKPTGSPCRVDASSSELPVVPPHLDMGQSVYTQGRQY